MKTQVFKFVIYLLSLFILNNSVVAQIVYKMTEIAPNLLLFTPNDPGVGTCVAILHDRGGIMIDASYSPTSARAIVGDLSKQNNLPIKYLINTHWHDDHIWGNQSFRKSFPDVQIVSHANTFRDIKANAIPGLKDNVRQIELKVAARDSLLEAGIEDGIAISESRRALLTERQKLFKSVLSDYKSIKPSLPDIVFTDTLILHPGPNEVEIIYLGSGHTDGDVVIYMPAAKVAILGDLVTLPIPAGATVPLEEQLETLHKILTLDAEIWIPGHGDAMTDTNHIEAHIDLLKSMQNLMKEAQLKSLNLEQTIALAKGKKLGRVFTKDDPKLIFGFNRFFIQTTLEFLFEELAK